MRASLSLPVVAVMAAILLAACGGGDAESSASEGAGRAIPTAIGDLQADCDRGAPGSCEALDDRLGGGLSADETGELVCASWSDLQLAGPNVAAAAQRIIDIAGAELPAEVVAALETMVAGSDDAAEQSLDVVDEHFLPVC